jgi:hypothetical protein
MNHQPDLPEPGEDANPVDLWSESPHTLIPDGEILDGDAGRDRRRHKQPLIPTLAPDAAETRDPDAIRRTSTDRDALRVVVAHKGETDRLDHSAHDLQRETVIDPAQDDTGPQSDKG